MSDGAKLASVVIRLVACALIAQVLFGVVVSVVGLIVGASQGRAAAPPATGWLWYVAMLAPGLVLFRWSRALGRAIARGLD